MCSLQARLIKLEEFKSVGCVVSMIGRDRCSFLTMFQRCRSSIDGKD